MESILIIDIAIFLFVLLGYLFIAYILINTKIFKKDENKKI